MFINTELEDCCGKCFFNKWYKDREDEALSGWTCGNPESENYAEYTDYDTCCDQFRPKGGARK